MFYIDINRADGAATSALLAASKQTLLTFYWSRQEKQFNFAPSPPILCYNFGQDDKNDNNNDILSSANIGSASGKLGLGLNH